MRLINRPTRLGCVAPSVALLWAWALLGQNAADPLLQGFENVPDSAKPRVWWHWMSGNVTKEGIKLDFEWFKRVGIVGFQNSDALKPFEIELDALFRDVTAHPVPPDSRLCAVRHILEALEQRIGGVLSEKSPCP